MWRAVAAALIVAVSGCAHPVGPARTYGKYEGKATTTAEAALSNVEVVRLTARTAARDRAFGPYVGSVVSDAEESLDGLAGTFGSIQPPDDRADDLQARLDQLLGDALDHVTDVRVAARRGQLATLDDTAAALAGDAEHLRAFVEQHS
jgi:hypothetical protein